MEVHLNVGGKVGTVMSFVADMQRHFTSVPRNVDMIRKLYDEFITLTVPLPHVVKFDKYVEMTTLFRYLYSEMRYRQIFALSPPTVKQWIGCWNNYCRLFQFLIPNMHMQLPNKWLWDMIDGFVNLFQSFCEFRATATFTVEDLDLLDQHDWAWSVFGTLNLLLLLVRKSSIREILDTAAEDGVSAVTDDSGEIDILRALGYFSLAGLLRVHCLLGLFETGLKRLEPLNISHPGFYTCLIESHITTVYHCLFARFMLGRYIEAMSGLQMFLVHFSKTPQLSQKSRDFEHQMYALLALCHVLCSPPHNLIDDANVESKLKEQFGEKISRMKTSEVVIFYEVLNTAWPIFMKPFAPHIGETSVVDDLCKFLRGHEDILQHMYPCIPFHPDDKYPYISHADQLAALNAKLAADGLSKLKLK